MTKVNKKQQQGTVSMPNDFYCSQEQIRSVLEGLECKIHGCRCKSRQKEPDKTEGLIENIEHKEKYSDHEKRNENIIDLIYECDAIDGLLKCLECMIFTMPDIHGSDFLIDEIRKKVFKIQEELNCD